MKTFRVWFDYAGDDGEILQAKSESHARLQVMERLIEGSPEFTYTGNLWEVENLQDMINCEEVT